MRFFIFLIAFLYSNNNFVLGQDLPYPKNWEKYYNGWNKTYGQKRENLGDEEFGKYVNEEVYLNPHNYAHYVTTSYYTHLDKERIEQLDKGPDYYLDIHNAYHQIKSRIWNIHDCGENYHIAEHHLTRSQLLSNDDFKLLADFKEAIKLKGEVFKITHIICEIDPSLDLYPIILSSANELFIIRDNILYQYELAKHTVSEYLDCVKVKKSAIKALQIQLSYEETTASEKKEYNKELQEIMGLQCILE